MIADGDTLVHDWRTRLYTGYVSSGQALTRVADVEKVLRLRGPFYRQVIRLHVPTDRNAMIADLGCGYGALVHHLQHAGYANATGVDASAEQVSLAGAAGIKGVCRNDVLEFLRAQPGESLDVVFAMDLLEHLKRAELFATLDEVRRVLKPAGRLIAHVPNASGIFGGRIRYGDLTHELSFTPKSVHQVLSTVGFKDVRWYEDRPISQGIKSWIRAGLWTVMTIPFRLLLLAENGPIPVCLSQNMLVVADRE